MSTTSPDLPVDFSFTPAERETLVQRLEAIPLNPYRAYPAFRHAVRLLVAAEPLLQRLADFCEQRRRQSAYERPFAFLENCPIDRELPELDPDEPVTAKHARKHSFVAEGFLQLYAEVAGEHPISYLNVNGGDVFQDIYPKTSLHHTQSQKALGAIHFHKDLANHFVRPDLVNILALRSSEANDIHTTFVANRDVLAALDRGTQAVLREEAFHTPYDDLSVMGGTVPLGAAAHHAVLTRDVELRFFEHRTVGLTDSATRALQRLRDALHAHKRRVRMRSGDFVSIANNLSLHGKEVGEIRDPGAQLRRWSIKTVNVHSIAPHLPHLVAGTDYLVHG